MKPWQRRAAAGMVAALTLIVGVELVARFAMGLGDPPLWVEHPNVLYMLKPDQDVRRFGNRFSTNALGMRSDDYPAQRSTPEEFRVLFIGDSVINGGALVDQDDLATELLADEWTRATGRRVVAGNLSSGGWGPCHWLEYVRAFGFHDADAIVIYLSSHDIVDVNDARLDPALLPTRRPLSATTEGIMRYLPRYLGRATPPPEDDARAVAQKVARTTTALGELLALSRAHTPHVYVFLHPTRPEATTEPLPWVYEEMRRVLEAAGHKPHETRAALRAAIEAGREPYRPADPIHPNAVGQRVMADEIGRVVPIAEILKTTAATGS